MLSEHEIHSPVGLFGLGMKRERERERERERIWERKLVGEQRLTSVRESIDARILLWLVVVDRCKSSKISDINLAILSANHHLITVKNMPRCMQISDFWLKIFALLLFLFSFSSI